MSSSIIETESGKSSRTIISFFDLHHYSPSRSGVCSAEMIESAHVTDAKRKESERWGIADAATRPATGHLPKGGTWWSLLHAPMAAHSRADRCPTGDFRRPVRGVERPSPWPPLWTVVRSVAAFMPFHRHGLEIRRISSLQGSAFGCLNSMDTMNRRCRNSVGFTGHA